MSKPGTVYLVGAGPGDPGLITVKGLRCLEQADVVVYDRLSNPDLLRHARPEAEKLFMGKEPGTPGEFQQAINQTMKQLKARGLIDILPDPEDGRCKVIAFAEEGAGMRADALEIMELMEQELVDRIGVKTVNAMYEALERNWGDIPIFDHD